jgi:hypothetical protein
MHTHPNTASHNFERFHLAFAEDAAEHSAEVTQCASFI